MKYLFLYKQMCLLLVIILFAGKSKAQDTIPFTFTAKNNISIEGVFNGKDTLDLMFHTAASEVALIEEAAKKMYELENSKSVMAETWGGQGEAKYIKNNYLEIGNFRWDSLTVWVDKLSGQGTQGKFGPNLFEKQIIELDFENKELIIHPSLPKVLESSAFQKFEFTSDRGILYIEGKLKIGENVYVNKFMIHSGYGGTILLDNQFAGENKIGEQVEVISESQLKDSYGNVLKTKKAILPILEIAGHEFTDIPISFFEGTIGNQRNCVLGSEILKRFTIMLDQEKGFIYFKPNSLMQNSYKDV